MHLDKPIDRTALIRALAAAGVGRVSTAGLAGLGPPVPGTHWIAYDDGVGTIVAVDGRGRRTMLASFRMPENGLATAAVLQFAVGEGQSGAYPAPPPGATVSAADFGVRADGRSDDTSALARALAAGRGGTVRLPAGRISVMEAMVASRTRVVGQGIGRTILIQRAGSRGVLLRNERSAQGDTALWLEGFTVDGNAPALRHSTHGVHMNQVRDSYFDIECRNARNAGFLMTNGGANRFGPRMFCHRNGKEVPGYGLYIHNSDDNQIHGGRFDDNCIGVAVESSGSGHARRNTISNVTCSGNRADFQQSGAGIHFEQSAGNDCNEGLIIDCLCEEGTGVGIANTGTNLKISGGRIRGNRGGGIVTVAAKGFIYSGITLERNAAGATHGYRAEMRFDDTGLRNASSGDVVDCVLIGSAPDGAVKTMSSFSRITFSGNRASGYAVPYNTSGQGNRVLSR